ncbi:MAG: nucleoside phosphorylase [Pseudomonadota bacterium]
MGDLSPTIGIVCGLRSEVQCAERALGPDRDRAIILASGSSSERATEQADGLIHAGVAALVSFGIGGALDPALRIGDVVRSTRVACDDGTFGATGDPLIWGSDRIVGGAAAKAALHARTGAVLVDMESHAVARATSDAGLPFLVMRAVSDDAATDLPGYLGQAVKSDGTPNLRAVIAGLIRQPSTLPALIRLGRDTAKALDALEQVAKTEFVALLRRINAG